jgi:ubiquinone/menaquinone biosynthesis C-methylase UbiE
MQTTRPASRAAKKHVEALFDSLALEYARERERQFSFIAQKRLVIDLLAGAQGRLLEVGCGPAVMAPDLLAMGFELHGIDVSAEMIRRAELRIAGHPLVKRCRFAIGDVESLDFPDAVFDAVLAMGVLEYLEGYDRALQEMRRVLKPGGVLLLTIPNRASAYHLARGSYQKLRDLARRLRRMPAPRAASHSLCVPWLLDRQLERAGLRKLESRACNFIFFPLKELQPRASEALSRALMPLAASRLAPLIGAQYILKTQKIA